MRFVPSRVILLLAAAATAIAALPAPAQTNTSPVIYLDQGWSQADREMYYQTSQGGAAMSYDIYLNLEVAGGQELFRSDANSERFGLTVQSANPRTNPDALPVGVAKTVVTEAPWKGTYASLTCSACHNAQLNYKGKRIRIDGGVGAFDIQAYINALDDAMQATVADKAKFDRLVQRMGPATPAANSELRKRVERDAARIHDYRTTTFLTPLTFGPHRMDAISALIGRLTSGEPGIPENWFPALAPTKIPFLWNSPQGSWTQWRGEQQDPLQRNMVEVGGVFLLMNLRSKTPEQGLFSSSAMLLNLGKIEDALNRLAPPKWPEEVFGPIDRVKAASGKALFMTHCAECHNAYPYTWTEPNKYGKRWIQVGLVPQSYVGTDRGQFEDTMPLVMTKQLAPYVVPPFTNQPTAPTGALYVTIQKWLDDTALAKLKLTDEEAIKLHGYREFPLPRPSPGVYKAAPRDGVWATPPFLHNGSVPNLYEMLVPAKERTKKFYYGRDFDPVKVGVDTSATTGFLLDTSLRGNSNAGHSFEDGAPGINGVIGPLLTEAQRWELVEYLKSIPEEPGRVTPFGGPPDAKSGKPRWAYSAP